MTTDATLELATVRAQLAALQEVAIRMVESEELRRQMQGRQDRTAAHKDLVQVLEQQGALTE